jgi:hypothetical protein
MRPMTLKINEEDGFEFDIMITFVFLALGCRYRITEESSNVRRETTT